MPGLVGWFSSGTPVPETVSAVSGLLHEPYYRRTVAPAHFHGRVEIVDNGSYPELAGAASRDGVVVAYYGEFYNPEFAAAETGDAVAQILLRLYDAHGEDLPKYLDGSFAAVVFDGATALVFNDHCASRPLFYAFRNGALFFGPEIKAVASHPGVDRSINEEAFVSFLVNGALSGEQTFYRGVRALRPGSILRVTADGCSADRRFHYLPNGQGADPGDEECVEQMSEALLEAVRRRFRRPASMIVPISGGIDSRGILGCVHRFSAGAKIATVSWGNDETTPGTDACVARQVAALLGAEHHFLPRRSAGFEENFEEMFTRLDGLTDDVWMHHAELGAVRAIRGLGGLAIWRGEESFGHWPKPVSEFVARMNSGYHLLLDHPELQRVFSRGARDRFLRIAAEDGRRLSAECPARDLTDRRDYWYYHERLFHYHTRGSYFKMTVLEVKSPWLDKRLIRFLEGLPVRYRVERMLYKRALARLFPELMAIPPATVTSLESWPDVLRADGKIQALLRFHLLESRSPIHDWLDRQAVAELLEAAFHPAAHRAAAGWMGAARTVLRQASPALFNVVKSLAGSRAARLYPAPPSRIAMRLLCAKRWFDRFA